LSYLLDLYHKDQEAETRRREKAASEGSSWVNKIRRRYEDKTNTDICVTGERGVGKSTLSLRLGEILKPEWFMDRPEESVEKFVTFSGAEFGRAIKNSPDGSLICGDEFGQQMHHREFMTAANVALSSVLQGYRYKRFITFLNLPGIRYLDADSEGLITYQAHLEHRGDAEVFRISHPKFKGSDFHHTVLDHFRFGPPSVRLWKAYEAKKFPNQDRVIDRAIKIMEDSEQSRLTNAEAIDIVVADPDAFFKQGTKELDANLIVGLGVNINRAYSIRAIAARRLGLPLKAPREP
jgi:energy-coupling factor transporter ATP-binding protein EcfA2